MEGKSQLLLFVVVGLVVLTACNRDGMSNAGPMDAAPSSDADTDTDPDTESDSETETTTDTEPDVECEPDPSPDTDGWPEPGPHELSWVIATGGLGRQSPLAVKSYGPEGCLVSGLFTESLTLGAGEPTERSWNEQQGGFVARFAGDGALVWAAALLGEEGAYPAITDLVVSDDGSITAVGDYDGVAYVEDANGTLVDIPTDGGLVMVLLRFTPDGALVWSKQLAAGDIWARKMEPVPEGALLLAGEFEGDVLLGEGEPAQTTIDSTGDYSDGYLALFDSLGELQWVTTLEAWTAYLTDVSVAEDGTIVAVGWYDSELTIAPGQVTETVLTDDEGADGWIARFTLSGEVQWAQRIETSYMFWFANVAHLADGSLVMTGKYSGEVTLGAGQTEETTFSSGSDYNDGHFTALLDGDGLLQWAREEGPTDDLDTYAVAVLPDGSYIIAYSFSGYVVLEPDGPNETSFSSGWNNDSLLVHYGADHSLLWAAREGVGVTHSRPGRVDAVDVSAIHLAGVYYAYHDYEWTEPLCQDTTFGPGQAGETTFAVNKHHDNELFVAQIAATE